MAATTATADVVPLLLSALGGATGGNDDDVGPAAPLARWNDGVEFGFGSVRRPPPAAVEALMSQAAEALQSNLVRCVASHPETFAAEGGSAGRYRRRRSGGDGSAGGGGDGGGDGAAVGSSVGSFSPGDSISDVEADRAASDAARSVLRASAAADGAEFAPDSSDGGGGDREEERKLRLALTSELLRASKNLIRHRNQSRLEAGIRFTRGSEEEEEYDDPLRRLRSPGTLMLYLTLLDCCSGGGGSRGGGNSSTTTAAEEEERAARDDAARNASLALFHATYGRPDENPPASRARTALVEEVDGLPVLLGLLARGYGARCPTPLLLGLVRIVHSLVGSDTAVAGRMDRALGEMTMGWSAEENDEEEKDVEKDPRQDDERSVGDRVDLTSVLVATLAGAVRSSDPAPFPGTDAGDRRADLACEVLRVLFALRVVPGLPSSADAAPSSNGNDNGDDADDGHREGSGESGDGDGGDEGDGDSAAASQRRLGVLLHDLLHVPNSDGRAYATKLAAINLLMDCPRGYARYLRAGGAIRPLLTVMRIQLDEVVVVKTGSSAADAAAVVPILAVLERLAADDADVMKLVKEEIFPPDAEEAYATRARAETEKMGGRLGERGGRIRAKNMQPIDAPPGTVRWKLIRLMTWIESNVKRTSSELLWTVCGGDPTEFVLRTGYGNSVHMLGIKGLVKIPKESSVKF